MTRDDYYAQINTALAEQNWAAIPSALVAVALNSEVLEQDYELVLGCVRVPSVDVRAVALICIAHLARVHRRLPDDRAAAIIKDALVDPEFEICGQADAAADDLEMFVPELGQHIRGRLLPNFLLHRAITWKKVSTGRWTTQALGHVCNVRMNASTDEPLYTLSIGAQAVDFDDPPSIWIIPLG